MIRIEIVNKLSGSKLSHIFELDNIEDAKNKIIKLAELEDYLEVGDVIKITEV